MMKYFRGASVIEADSSGDLPIHWAARAGRGKNIDVLVKHAKTDCKLFMHLFIFKSDFNFINA